MNKFPRAWVGIDPGQTGAIALLHSEGHEVADFPGDPTLASDMLRTWACRFDLKLVALEKVSAFPKQGVVSVFSFGQNLGMWQGILATLGVPYIMPTPKQWQKGLVDRKAGTDNKTRSLVTARRLFPEAELHLKKHHNRADALLIAFWAWGGGVGRNGHQ